MSFWPIHSHVFFPSASQNIYWREDQGSRKIRLTLGSLQANVYANPIKSIE